MSHKLNAEELAAKRYQPVPNSTILTIIGIDKAEGYAAAIREVAQPIANERDELRQLVVDMMQTPIPEEAYHWLSDNSFTERINAILTKYAEQ
jgi:hypothetical protein